MKNLIIPIAAALVASALTAYAQAIGPKAFTAFFGAPPGGAATIPLSGTETVLIIQGGALKSVAVSQLSNQANNVTVQGTPGPGECPVFVSAKVIGSSAAGVGCLLAQ